MKEINLKKGLVRGTVAATVISCSAWAIAGAMNTQAGQAAPPRGTSGAAPGQARTPVATAAPSQDSNSVIRLLRFAMTTEQNRLLGLTNDAAKRDQIIRAVNVGMISTTSPDQTADYVASLQIDKYRKHDANWQKVGKTKSTMNSLLTVDPKVEGYVDTEWEKTWNEIVERDKSDLVAHREWLTKRVQGIMNTARGMLDKDDQKELDAVWSTFKANLPTVRP